MFVCDTTKKRLIAVSVFFFAVGIPDGFTYTTLAAALAERGVTVSQIGYISALATLPWTLKLVCGIIIDRFPLSTVGSRRPWILIGQIGMTAACFCLLGYNDLLKMAPSLAWLVFGQNIFAAFQDTAVDAMAVDILPESEKGRANGFMRAANIAGVMFGGVFLSFVITHLTWRAALSIQATVMSAACVFSWLVVEQHDLGACKPLKASTSWIGLLQLVLIAFKKRAVVLAAMAGIAAALASGLFGTATNVFFIQKLGWSRASFVSLSGGWSYIIGFIAALGGGVLADRFGHTRIAICAAICTATAVAAIPLLQHYWRIPFLMGVLLVLQSITSAALGVSMFAMYMDLSGKEIAATQYSAFMACLNLGGAFGEKLIGPIVARVNWAGAFSVTSGIFGITAILLAFLNVRKLDSALEADGLLAATPLSPTVGRSADDPG